MSENRPKIIICMIEIGLLAIAIAAMACLSRIAGAVISRSFSDVLPLGIGQLYSLVSLLVFALAVITFITIGRKTNFSGYFDNLNFDKSRLLIAVWVGVSALLTYYLSDLSYNIIWREGFFIEKIYFQLDSINNSLGLTLVLSLSLKLIKGGSREVNSKSE